MRQVRELRAALNTGVKMAAADPTKTPLFRFEGDKADYRIDGVIDSGARGVVCLAKETRVDQKTALKLIPYADGEGERVIREARAAAVDSDYIVDIRRVGRGTLKFSRTEVECLAIAMPYIEGPNLRDWMYTAQNHDPHVTAGILVDAARGLAEAHANAKRSVHGDVKPENVVVGVSTGARWVDFGLAQKRDAGWRAAVESSEPSLSAFAGTPDYMAPEAIREGAQTAKTDQFSLAMTIWEVLAMRPRNERERQRPPPIDGRPCRPELEDFRERWWQRFHHTRRIPRALRAVLKKALSVNPEERFADLSSLISELRTFAQTPARRRATMRNIAFMILGSVAGVTAVVGGIFYFGMELPASLSRPRTALVEEPQLSASRRPEPSHALERASRVMPAREPEPQLMPSPAPQAIVVPDLSMMPAPDAFAVPDLPSEPAPDSEPPAEPGASTGNELEPDREINPDSEAVGPSALESPRSYVRLWCVKRKSKSCERNLLEEVLLKNNFHKDATTKAEVCACLSGVATRTGKDFVELHLSPQERTEARTFPADSELGQCLRAGLGRGAREVSTLNRYQDKVTVHVKVCSTQSNCGRNATPRAWLCNPDKL